MPTYQGGLPGATSTAVRGFAEKTRAGYAAATSSGPTGTATKAVPAAGVPTAAGASAATGATEKSWPATVPAAGGVGPHGVGGKDYRAGGLPTGGGASVVRGTPVKTWPGRPGVVEAFGLGGVVVPVITDGQFDDAEQRAERWPAWSLKVDWTNQDFTGVAADLTDTVRSVEVERSITGELPDESGVVDGYATGTMTAHLGGRRPGASLELAAELSPFRADSPLYGQTLVTPTARFDLGLLTDYGPKSYRQLTGPVRTVKVSEQDQAVELTAVDPSERIRALITLPTYAEFVSHAKRRNWALTINTQWVVDHVLRANGIYASPPPRADAIISCTGHGGLASEIGFNGAPISLVGNVPQNSLWTEDGHPYGMLGSPEPRTASGTVGYIELYGITDGFAAPFRFAAGYGVGLSLLLHQGSWMTYGASQEWRVVQIRPGNIVNDNADNDTPRLFLNAFGDGGIYAGLVGADGTVYATPKVATAAKPRWRHVGVFYRMASATSLEVTIRCDAITRTYTLPIPSQTPPNGYRPTLQVNPQMTRSWTNLHAWVGSSVPTLAEWQAVENHVPAADVGQGVNELLYLPDVAAQDSWEVLKAAVGAEFGVHGFDENGRYFFRPRTDTRRAAVDVDVTVDDNLADVAYSLSSDSVRNVIGYSSTPRYHDSKFQTVLKADDILQFVCPPGISRFWMDWPWGAAGRHGGTVQYYFCDQGTTPNPTPQWSSSVAEGWTYSYGSTWTGEQNIYLVYVYWCRTDHRRVLITVNNTGSQPVRLATDADVKDLVGSPGEPALHIGGWPMIEQPAHVEEYRDEDSIATYRSPRALSLGASDWRQTPDVLDPVATELLAAMAEPVPVLEDLPVRGNPRVQVGQVARLTFRGRDMQPVIGTIIKTHRTLDGDGITDLISVRPLPEQPLAPDGWVFFVDVSHYQFEQSPAIDLARLADLGYAGCIAKIGQGAGHTTVATSPQTYGQTLDPLWSTARDQGRAIWGSAFAGYWYVGNDETPASQASRCAAAIGDKSIPVMLDWEDGGGDLANVVAVRDAFRSAGLKVTVLYCGSGYVSNSAGGGNPTNVSAATGLYVIRARSWTEEYAHPRVLFDDQPDPRGFYLGAFNGATPVATQFTAHGVVYPDLSMDVDAFPGTAAQLARMLNGLNY